MYEGWFKENKYYGSGRLIRSNGDVLDGLWAHNILQGKGHVKYSDGMQHIGNFIDFKIDGKGAEYAKDYKYIGDFVLGKKQGQG